jgi:hypothetical protein
VIQITIPTQVPDRNGFTAQAIVEEASSLYVEQSRRLRHIEGLPAGDIP